MGKNKKILVIDDDEQIRKMYAEVFRNADFDVTEAKDGLEGLEKATAEMPDAIFTGIIMPRMDGFMLIESLKKNTATANIPVVISSHMGREEDRQRANVLGARHFVVKGFTSPKEVVEKIKSIFIGGKEYRLEINNLSMDAPKLARDLGLNSNFQCLECGNDKLVLKIIAGDGGKSMETELICPNCGWQAK